MKKILLASAALLALGSASAVAADLPARTYNKAPVYAAPIYNWTGFYVGAHVGGAFSGNNDINTLGPAFTSTNNSGFLGGGQLGADYQFAPNWLIGIEGQISGLDYSRNYAIAGGPPNFRDKSDWLASVTGRLGYTWGPGLIYAKGGVAFRDNGGFSSDTAGFSVARDDTGYTVGGGLEYLFAPQWSAKIEYQYYNFDRTTLFATGTPLATYNNDIHTVKAGINYHFNWGGPVVAKY